MKKVFLLTSLMFAVSIESGICSGFGKDIYVNLTNSNNTCLNPSYVSVNNNLNLDKFNEIKNLDKDLKNTDLNKLKYESNLYNFNNKELSGNIKEVYKNSYEENKNELPMTVEGKEDQKDIKKTLTGLDKKHTPDPYALFGENFEKVMKLLINEEANVKIPSDPNRDQGYNMNLLTPFHWKTLDIINKSRNDMIEVGPGARGMTPRILLLKNKIKITAIEFEKKAAEELQKTIQKYSETTGIKVSGRYNIINGDAIIQLPSLLKQEKYKKPLSFVAFNVIHLLTPKQFDTFMKTISDHIKIYGGDVFITAQAPAGNNGVIKQYLKNMKNNIKNPGHILTTKKYTMVLEPHYDGGFAENMKLRKETGTVYSTPKDIDKYSPTEWKSTHDESSAKIVGHNQIQMNMESSKSFHYFTTGDLISKIEENGLSPDNIETIGYLDAGRKFSDKLDFNNENTKKTIHSVYLHLKK